MPLMATTAASRNTDTTTIVGAMPLPSAPGARSKRKRSFDSAPLSSARTDAAAASADDGTGVAVVQREVEQGLDGLKDKLFRLELRRQAGTVSEEEYLRERTQTEKILRELVGR